VDRSILGLHFFLEDGREIDAALATDAADHTFQNLRQPIEPLICEDVTFFEIVFGARFHQRLPVFLRKSAYGHDWDIGRDAVVFQAR